MDFTDQKLLRQILTQGVSGWPLSGQPEMAGHGPASRLHHPEAAAVRAIIRAVISHLAVTPWSVHAITFNLGR